jgi:hypothetical protein
VKVLHWSWMCCCADVSFGLAETGNPSSSHPLVLGKALPEEVPLVTHSRSTDSQIDLALALCLVCSYCLHSVLVTMLHLTRFLLIR